MKIKKIIATIMITVIFAAVFFSCKKDINGTPGNNIKTPKYTAEELSVWHKLVNFNKKVKTGIRVEEFITPDSAMWYLEALFNVTQAVDTTYENMELDTTYYSLPVNGDGMVSMTDIVAVYNQMLSDKDNYLNGIPSTYKFLLFGDLEQNSSSARDGNFQISSVDGYGINPLVYYEPFTSVDNWYYGNMFGRCDGQYLWQSDAGQELQRRFNNPSISYNIPHDSAHALVIKTKLAYYYEYPNYMYNDTLAYDNNGNLISGDTCIPYTGMQWYLSKGHSEIIYKFESQGGKRPDTLDFLNMNVWTNQRGGEKIDNYHYLYYHNYAIRYAQFVIIPPIGE